MCNVYNDQETSGDCRATAILAHINEETNIDLNHGFRDLSSVSINNNE